LKWDFLNEQMARDEMELFNEQLLHQSRIELLDQQVAEELGAAATIEKIKVAGDKFEIARLKQEHKLQQERIKLIEAEVLAREEATFHMVNAGMRAHRAGVDLGEQMGNLVKNRIKQIIAEAVAVQIGKALSSIPFPFNIIAAPAAGLLVAAMLNRIIPTFEVGGMVSGNRHTQGGELINVEGGEFIVNREATRGNIQLLEAINSGGSLNVRSMGEGFNGMIAAINDQTKKLAEVERIVRMDPEHLDDEYNNYLNEKEHVG